MPLTSEVTPDATGDRRKKAAPTAKKRTTGAEGIEPFGDGKWRIRCYLGKDSEGKKQYHQRVVSGTLREARAERARILNDRARRPTTVVPRTRLTLGAWLDACINEHFPATYAPRTVATCKQLFRVHVPPTLRAVPLARCTPDIFRAFLTELSATKTRGRETGKGGRKGGEPIASSSVARVRSALGMAFNAAIARDMIAYNPVLGHKLPRTAVKLIRPSESHVLSQSIADQNRPKGMSVGEAGRLLLAADRLAHERVDRPIRKARRIDRVTDRTWPLWRVWLEVGARPAEMQGLTWDHVEWRNEPDGIGACIHIQHALTESHATASGSSTWSWKKTKTGDHRVIPISVEAAERLRWLQEAQSRDRKIADHYHEIARDDAEARKGARLSAAEIAELPKRYQNLNLVFADYLGKPVSLTVIRKRINAICDVAELPRRTPYEIRTTMASIVATLIPNETLVQHRLGHSVSGSTAARFYVKSQEGDQNPVTLALREALNKSVLSARETAEKAGTPLPPMSAPPLPLIETFTRPLHLDELYKALA